MKNQLKAVVIFSSVFVLLASCANNQTKNEAHKVNTADTLQVLPPVQEDTLITKIRPVLFYLENQELSFNGRKPFDLAISNIQYHLISLKEYYTEQQTALLAQAKYSTNAAKTQKALNYLSNMIKQPPPHDEIYRAQFHLKAQVDKTCYNEEKILYLEKDLKLMQLIFPL
jgi:hypothetical protein